MLDKGKDYLEKYLVINKNVYFRSTQQLSVNKGTINISSIRCRYS